MKDIKYFHTFMEVVIIIIHFVHSWTKKETLMAQKNIDSNRGFINGKIEISLGKKTQHYIDLKDFPCFVLSVSWTCTHYQYSQLLLLATVIWKQGIVYNYRNLVLVERNRKNTLCNTICHVFKIHTVTSQKRYVSLAVMQGCGSLNLTLLKLLIFSSFFFFFFFFFFLI